MADHANDNTYIDVETMLVGALSDRANNGLNGKHALLLVLDKGPDGTSYGVRYRAANMRRSEMVALLESLSHRFKSELNG